MFAIGKTGRTLVDRVNPASLSPGVFTALVHGCLRFQGRLQREALRRASLAVERWREGCLLSWELGRKIKKLDVLQQLSLVVHWTLGNVLLPARLGNVGAAKKLSKANASCQNLSPQVAKIRALQQYSTFFNKPTRSHQFSILPLFLFFLYQAQKSF